MFECSLQNLYCAITFSLVLDLFGYRFFDLTLVFILGCSLISLFARVVDSITISSLWFHLRCVAVFSRSFLHACWPINLWSLMR